MGIVFWVTIVGDSLMQFTGPWNSGHPTHTGCAKKGVSYGYLNGPPSDSGDQNIVSFQTNMTTSGSA